LNFREVISNRGEPSHKTTRVATKPCAMLTQLRTPSKRKRICDLLTNENSRRAVSFDCHEGYKSGVANLLIPCTNIFHT